MPQVTANKGEVLKTTFLHLLAIVLAVMFSYPYFHTLMSSLKGPWEIYTYPPRIFPEVPQFRNYIEVFVRAPFARWFYNTLHLVALSTTGSVLTSSIVAYSFARFDYRFKDLLFTITLSTLMLPAQVTLIPQFILFYQLGELTPIQFLDTLRPLWIPAWFGGSAFGIFLMRQFIRTIPRDLDEAALIDGASYPRIFATIIAPLCKPAIATLAILQFLGTWNAFIQPLIYINSPKKFPISVGVHYFKQTAGGMDMREPSEHLVMVAGVLSTIVPIALFFSAQSVFVRGMAMSGIKG